MPRCTTAQKLAARQVDLYDYCRSAEPDEWIVEGMNNLRNRKRHSLVVTKGMGFYDNAGITDRHGVTKYSGNGIDYLTLYKGYDFVIAVFELVHSHGQTNAEAKPTEQEKKDRFTLPQIDSNSFRQVMAYLTKTRGIDEFIVKALIQDKLLYQSSEERDGKTVHNAVFTNKGSQWAEIRGTMSAVKFAHIVPGSASDGYWCFGDIRQKKADSTAIVCEGAIDAMSVYQLIRQHDVAKLPGKYFCSVGGCEKTQGIEHIIQDFKTVYLAFDNDKPGQDGMAKFVGNEEFPTVCRLSVPAEFHDWNDMLRGIRINH